MVTPIRFDMDYGFGSGSDAFLVTDKDLGIDERRLSHNNLSFKKNIFPPRSTIIDNREYKVYQARFDNLYELYDYLKSNPKTNSKIFSELASIKNPESFAGKPYSEALEDLIRTTSEDYQEFLKISEYIYALDGLSNKYKKYLTPTTGRLIIPSFCAGKPNCYESSKRIKEPKYINIHVSLAYEAHEKKEKILNRALIITNILKALEDAGYIINLDTFELSYLNDEIAYIVVGLKNYNDKLDMQALYKSLCKIEFRRRILFRVLETLDVTNSWNYGYGYVCDKDFISKFLDFEENDIYFEGPSSMGIKGLNLIDDFNAVINHLGLKDTIDIEEVKKQYKTRKLK